MELLKQWYKAHEQEILRDFFTFLRFQSLSGDPAFKPQAEAAAQWLCAYMNQMGLETTLWQTSGLPVVFGSYEKAGKDRPTLLIYHHYDVQPIDPIELWDSPPFEPEIRQAQVYARGAVDNKGQCFYSLTAIKAWLALGKKLNFNLKVFIEGEEESGGAGTAAILASKKQELQADYLLVVDFDIPSISSPGITLGMRGIVTMEVECRNSTSDLHSGIHGGIALNPNRALVTLLSSFWDKQGRIDIAPFHDDILPLSEEDLSQMDMSFDLIQYQKTFGVEAFCSEEGVTLKQSNWLRPTLEINGMVGGYTGAGFKTVIPAQASAKISCRLVPNQDPIKVVQAIESHLKKHAPKGLMIKVTAPHGAPAYRCNFNSKLVSLVASAYEEVFKKPCQYLLCGASVPIIVQLAKVSCADVAMIGVGLAEDNIHAPNEHFGLDRFELGFLTMTKIFERLSLL